MAIKRDKKTSIVADVQKLLDDSKLTVFAHYDGVNVKQAQDLRRRARAAGVEIRVVKNRLVKVALGQHDLYKSMPTDALNGQLLYAFSDQDEVAPAQVLAGFAKDVPALELVGAFDRSTQLLSKEEVMNLAQLPSKDILRGQLVGTIAAPLSGFANVLAGNLRGLANVLNARAQAMN